MRRRGWEKGDRVNSQVLRLYPKVFDRLDLMHCVPFAVSEHLFEVYRCRLTFR